MKLSTLFQNLAASIGLLIERGLANVPGKLPPVVQHRNPRRNAQRKVVRQIGARQYRKHIKAARHIAKATLA